MSAYQEFHAHDAALGLLKRWAAKLGQDYHGGGGGIGGIAGTSSLKLEIYFQEYDGARNYHESPDDSRIVNAIHKAMREHGPAIVKRAIELMEATRADLAKAAAAEAAAVLDAVK